MKSDGRKWTSLASLLVFTLFALCLLLVLLTGAGVYRRLEQRSQDSYAQATAAQYIATRIHQGRRASVEDFEGCQALVFSEDFGGMTYLTRVYCCDGRLMELFCAEAAQLGPEDGEEILPLENLSFTLENGILQVNIGEKQLFFSLREGRQSHAQ